MYKFSETQRYSSSADGPGSRPLVYLVSSSPVSVMVRRMHRIAATNPRTSLSNTHLFSLRSSDRQFQSCWLWFSKHCQWVRNWSRQFSLMSLILTHVSATQLMLCCSSNYAHARGTPGDLTALLHAFKFTPAIGLGLAHHVVIIVGLASRPDKVRGTEEWRRTGSELLDLGDIVR